MALPGVLSVTACLRQLAREFLVDPRETSVDLVIFCREKVLLDAQNHRSVALGGDPCPVWNRSKYSFFVLAISKAE
jgi:hypothetical protein